MPTCIKCGSQIQGTNVCPVCRTPVIKLTKETFDSEVMSSDKPVLVDFWASWCGPCRMLSPIIDEIAEETTDAKICKVNVDEQPDLAQRYGVMSIPTLILFKNGEAVERSLGAKPKAAVLAMLKK